MIGGVHVETGDAVPSIRPSVSRPGGVQLSFGNIWVALDRAETEGLIFALQRFIEATEEVKAP